MTETLFSLANLIVLPAWLLLMIAPNCNWTMRATSFVLPFLLGLTYIGLLLTASLGKIDGGFMCLADLARVFENPYMVLAGWVHYLAYDLFVGSWQVRDAERRGLPHLLVVPCLVLTLVLGPVGLVCYLLLRWGHARRGLWYSAALAMAECYRRNRLLMAMGCGLIVCVLPLVLISTFDSRVVLGVNLWMRSAKFSASLGLYLLTLGCLLGYLPGPRWAMRTIRWVTVGAVFFEMPILLVQATRGVPSHFNETTPFDAILYNLMGSAAMVQMVMLAWVLFLFCTQRIAVPRVCLHGIRAGIVLTLAAIVPGLMMVMNGQHAVGVADGGAGLPLLNWSTVGGDLRIAHFLSLHALQVLPLAGFGLARMRTRLTEEMRSALMTAVTLIYALAIVVTLAQALAGQPIGAVHLPC
jgi:hypothetical protein